MFRPRSSSVACALLRAIAAAPFAALALTCAIVLAPFAARPHVVMGTPSLRMLTLQADFVGRVRIVDPRSILTLEDPPLRETVVVAEVLEPLKGSLSAERIGFVQRGHGVVSYEAGDEVLVFVRRIANHPELQKSRIASHVEWVSEQETSARFDVDTKTREAFASAVRAYVGLEKLEPSAYVDGLRRITLRTLASSHATLAASALRDLVLAKYAPIVTPEDLPVVSGLLEDPSRPIGFRIGLLAELERRGLVAGPERWAGLIRSTQGSDRIAVVRAAGAHPSSAVRKALEELLASKDTPLVAAVAVALGHPANAEAVPSLATLLDSSEVRIRMAAIRALGRVDSPAALAALAKAGASHPDAATRRRAAAEVAVLEGRSAPVGAAEGAARE